MLISQLIRDPDYLATLNERQINVLNTIVMSEVMSNETIKKELAQKVELALTAMRRNAAPEAGKAATGVARRGRQPK